MLFARRTDQPRRGWSVRKTPVHSPKDAPRRAMGDAKVRRYRGQLIVVRVSSCSKQQLQIRLTGDGHREVFAQVRPGRSCRKTRVVLVTSRRQRP